MQTKTSDGKEIRIPDCTYYSISIGGSKSQYAVWTYEKPYEAVASIKEYLAFIPRGSMQSKVMS
jgi:uncharacterized protein (DUF427 family)